MLLQGVILTTVAAQKLHLYSSVCSHAVVTGRQHEAASTLT